MAKSNPIRFSTKYQDDETGLWYYGHRYYQAQLGLWLSRDPLAELEGANVYSFVGNRPISYFDSDGRAVGANGTNAVGGAGVVIQAGAGGQAVLVTTGTGAAALGAGTYAGAGTGVSGIGLANGAIAVATPIAVGGALFMAGYRTIESYEAESIAIMEQAAERMRKDAYVREKAERRARRCKCEFIWVSHIGGDDRHNALAEQISGHPFEVIATTPGGLAARYDTGTPGPPPMDAKPSRVYEIKTRHYWLMDVDYNPVRYAWLFSRLMQLGLQTEVAARCGLDYKVVFDNPEAEKGMKKLFPDASIPTMVVRPLK